MKKVLDVVSWFVVGIVLLTLAAIYGWLVSYGVQYLLNGDPRAYPILLIFVGVPIICGAIFWLIHRGKIL